jgi:TPR repeat protein
VIAERAAEVFESDRAAAERGDQNAAAALGSVYLRGAGTDQDTAKALYWYERAGPRGWYAIAAIYDKGLGVPRDAEKAAEYYRRAAEWRDDPLAMYRLGTLYAEGRLAGRDDLEGYVWLLLAGRIGKVTPGCRNLDHWCNEHAIKDVPGYRARLRSRLSPEALVEAERRAAEREMTFKRGRGR